MPQTSARRRPRRYTSRHVGPVARRRIEVGRGSGGCEVDRGWEDSGGGDGGHGGMLLGLGSPLARLDHHRPLVQRLQLPSLDKLLAVDPDVRDLRAPRAVDKVRDDRVHWRGLDGRHVDSLDVGSLAHHEAAHALVDAQSLGAPHRRHVQCLLGRDGGGVLARELGQQRRRPHLPVHVEVVVGSAAIRPDSHVDPGSEKLGDGACPGRELHV
mmetsp:Transcript_60692/g.144368  ORF Transcript_60692/g.144368 Transcript_60692/m.144368 type:complete len:212 (-) Transcript_60692:929-1564(-)